MRWKLAMAAPVVALLVLVPDTRAQDVPLTMTMEPEKVDNHPADAVVFTFVDASGQQHVETVNKTNQHFQRLVGFVGPTRTDGRYHVGADVIIGVSHHAHDFSYDPTDTCTTSK